MSVLMEIDKRSAIARAKWALLGAMSNVGEKGLFFCSDCGMVSRPNGIRLSCYHRITATYSLERMTVADLLAFAQMVENMLETGVMVLRY